MNLSMPKRRAPRIMGVASCKNEIGLCVCDPWQIRGDLSLSFKEKPSNLKLKIFSFVSQQKPKVIVLLEEMPAKVESMARKIKAIRGLDLVRIEKGKVLGHLQGKSTKALRKRIASLFPSQVKVIDGDASLLACATAITCLHLFDFPSRTYVRPTSKRKNKNP